jgi:hypothetical protein
MEILLPRVAEVAADADQSWAVMRMGAAANLLGHGGSIGRHQGRVDVWAC